MTSNSNFIPKVIQVISFAINRYSSMPFVSRMELYDSLQNYVLSQENRIITLESKISQLQIKLESLEKDNIAGKGIGKGI